MSANNRGRIDCSTFIHLLIQGVPYEESFYHTGTVNDFFDSIHPNGDQELWYRLKTGRPA